MTLLDHGQPADTTTKKHHTGLIAVLAVLAVALLAAAAWLFVDRQHQAVSAEEQQAAIMEVITAHKDAINAGDRDAILATLTDDAAALYLGTPIGPQSVQSRDHYVRLHDDDFLMDAANKALLTFFDDPAFFGNPPQVSIPTRVEYPYRYPYEDPPPSEAEAGTYIFTLRDVGGQWKIATIVKNVS